MSERDIKCVIAAAEELLFSRDGDVSTGDGDFATCGTDEIIRLECAIVNFLDLPSDDVNHKDFDLIRHKIKELKCTN